MSSSVFVTSDCLENTTNQQEDKGRRLNSAPAKLYMRRYSESEEEIPANDGKDWRKFRNSCFGHAPFITEIIDQIKNPKFLILCNLIYSILLAVSNTIFISNPISGMMILSAMSYSAPKSAFLGIVTLLSGIFTAISILHLPMNLIRGGSVTFNCFLLGSLVIPLTVGDISIQEMWKFVLLCTALGIFVVILWAGVNGALSNVNLPVLNTPCNFLAVLLIFSGLLQQLKANNQKSSELLKSNDTTTAHLFYKEFNNQTQKTGESVPLQELHLSPVGQNNFFSSNAHNSTVSKCDSFDWTTWQGICKGVVLSQGQIFQTDVVGSIVIYLSILLYSPILLVQEVLGAVIGTVIGSLLCGQDCEDVFNGNWGYNPLLSCAAFGGIFVMFNFQSWFLSVVASVLTTFIYLAMKKNGLPVIGIPFQITMWIFIPIANLRKVDNASDHKKPSCFDLERVTEFSTPENNMILASFFESKCQKVSHDAKYLPK